MGQSTAVAELNVQERKTLKSLEKTVETNFEAFFKVGAALSEIREAKLYREGYKSFEEYVKKRWLISKSTAYEHITAHLIRRDLSDSGFTNLPVSVSQCVELNKTDDPKWVWESALSECQSDPKIVDAKTIRKVAESIPEDEVEDDDTEETEVDGKSPGELALAGKSEVQAIRRLTTSLFKQIDDCPEDGAFGILAINKKRILVDLDNVKNAIANSIPFAVCPYCKGVPVNCSGCSDTGIVNKSTWNNAPSELKNGQEVEAEVEE